MAATTEQFESEEACVQSVTLEQLIALNREICALSAAGVPLSDGLVRVANEFSGPSAALADRIAQRMMRGENLCAALDAEGDALPESYRAVVKAGAQSGRLTSALEGYTNTAIRMAELRRVVGLATLYPVFLLLAIWGLFLFCNNYVLPNFEWLDIDNHIWVDNVRFSFFRTGGPWRWLLWLLFPVSIVALTWIWWRRSATATEASIVSQPSWLGWIPGIAQIRRLSCQANFADLLRLFVEQRIPLTEALVLAAEGSGLRANSSEAQDLVAYLQSGNQLGTRTPAFRKLPPLVRLALASNRGPDSLADGLQRAADSYHERAQNWAQSASFYLPLGATALIGGTSVAAYAILLLQPYVATLHEVLRW